MAWVTAILALGNPGWRVETSWDFGPLILATLVLVLSLRLRVPFTVLTFLAMLAGGWLLHAITVGLGLSLLTPVAGVLLTLCVVSLGRPSPR